MGMDELTEITDWIANAPNEGISLEDQFEIANRWAKLMESLKPLYDKYHKPKVEVVPKTADLVSNDMAKAVMSGLFKMNFGID